MEVVFQILIFYTVGHIFEKYYSKKSKKAKFR